jgi:predicted RNase H-like HicB family nuclease
MKNKKDLEYYDKLPYNIILETWDDGKGQYYVARVAELPHCMIHGDTPEEAVREIETVKRQWIESNLKRGKKSLNLSQENTVDRSACGSRLRCTGY